MKIEVRVPSAGESVTEAEIGTWFKKDGDLVSTGDIIVEFETDKASLEFGSPGTGTLEILKKEGDVVKVNEVIAYVDTEATSTKPSSVKETTIKEVVATTSSKEVSVGSTSKEQKRVEVRVPSAGESVTEAEIRSWFKKSGDFVSTGDIILEFETDKASLEFGSPGTGKLEILRGEGELVKVNEVIAYVVEGSFPTNVKEVGSQSPSLKVVPSPVMKDSYTKEVASPSAKRILEEAKISLDKVVGTGKDGRLTKEDALLASSKGITEESKASNESFVSGDTRRSVRGERRQKLSRIRKAIANNLLTTKHQTAMLTTFNEIDMSFVMDLRKKYKEAFKEKYGVGLGFMSFFTKAVCNALLEFPVVNAFIEGEELVFHDYCDISVAVSTERGLIVPVIRNAESLLFDQIEKQIVDFAKRGRDGKITMDEMRGGTFTITNGGTFGSMLSTPIINYPQSAILGMHNIVERPIAINGQVHIRPIMYVALSYDHRLIDGAEAVRFLVRIKNLLEDPARLLINI